MSLPVVSSAELARLRHALRLVDLYDRSGASALASGWPLAESSPVLAALLDSTRTSAIPQSDAGALADILRGWRSYYGADYSGAGVAFSRAWSTDHGWRAWAALGLGKVCSDLGQWAHARSWLLAALAIARTETDFARMAECLGALGEVFLRCGRPRAALELFDADVALLPPGSGHRLRLQNYRAVALARVGRVDLATPLLWEAAFTAVGRQPVSALYSLASLAVCALRTRDAALHGRVMQVWGDAEDALVPVKRSAPLPVAVLGLCHAAFVWEASGARSPEVDRLLESVSRTLMDSYPLEQAWVDGLRGDGLDPDGSSSRWRALAHRAAPAPPVDLPVSAVDGWMCTEPLPSAGLVEMLRGTLAEPASPGVLRAGLEPWFV